MKRLVILGILGACATTLAAPAPVRPFEDYQVILDRKPFGAPPDPSQIPERTVPVSESFAASLQLSGIYELADGNLRVAITDKKDNSYFSLMVGEKDRSTGIMLEDADYDAESATLQKDGQVVVLSMNDTAGGQVLSASAGREAIRQAAELRTSYAERRRQRMLERQKPVEVPKPIYTGEELERHLQEYQMEILRGGNLPPLPVQLTPENDAKLVAEGVLPPVDDEGYEIEYEEDDGYYSY
ncbi:MAG TPA: hypothetical protein PLD40_08775 [Kiritimatiellia bacterium]|jgi:hypothetical protein|nr:hypothetical protein [Kiritimatiellia bacterium]OQC56610.1 MAG: hypothetical protein BWX54_01372 [Verrucomicrobia bacterium ADurb.Bin018]HOE01144.1 hypothetical protein [Kiritimatiellia bacterium]HOR74351.1 hypothetical protein [Kiritimatiellia bacterium]HOU59799.1 hypothetical protein [Kiritimatiellia bacterium]